MDDELRNNILLLKNGNKEAFDFIYHHYSQKIYKSALYITKNVQESEDIVQDTFLSCWTNIGSLKAPEAFSAWLTKIMMRTAIKKLKDKNHITSLDSLTDDSDTASFESLLQDNETPMPDDYIQSNELKAILTKAILDLDLKQRSVIVLFYYNELSIKEISSSLNIFEGTAKSRLNAGRNNIRYFLEKSGYSL